MAEYQKLNVYPFGFIYNGITFCWIKKELYRMPFERNKKSYSKLKLSQKKQGNSIGYRLNGDFKSMFRLDKMTKKINYKEVVTVSDGCPF
jgi:hypothetical protein